jgi:hypothetical protein
LCFLHPEAAPAGSNIVVRIALTLPPFEGSRRVTWCQAVGSAWQVGIEFLDQDMLFRLRMVEQICHIEHYRRTLRESQGARPSAPPLPNPLSLDAGFRDAVTLAAWRIQHGEILFDDTGFGIEQDAYDARYYPLP